MAESVSFTARNAGSGELFFIEGIEIIYYSFVAFANSLVARHRVFLHKLLLDQGHLLVLLHKLVIQMQLV